MKTNGLVSNRRQDASVAARRSGLATPTRSVAAAISAMAMAPLNTGKITPQLSPNQRAATTGTTGPASDPMAFTNCPIERLRE